MPLQRTSRILLMTLVVGTVAAAVTGASVSSPAQRERFLTALQSVQDAGRVAWESGKRRWRTVWREGQTRGRTVWMDVRSERDGKEEQAEPAEPVAPPESAAIEDSEEGEPESRMFRAGIRLEGPRRALKNILSGDDGAAKSGRVVTLKSYADIDGDIDRDLVGASIERDQIAWYENAGEDDESQWRTHVIASESRGLVALSAKDLDSDGDIDVIATFDDGRQFWYESSGGKSPGWVGHSR